MTVRDGFRAVVGALRGDESRVGIGTILVSAVVGLVPYAAVVLGGPFLVARTPLSASWPPALVLGSGTAALLAGTVSARGGRETRPTVLGAGAAAATLVLLSPTVAVGLVVLSSPVEGALLGGLLSLDGLFRFSTALAVPGFAFGAGIGYVVASVRSPAVTVEDRP